MKLINIFYWMFLVIIIGCAVMFFFNVITLTFSSHFTMSAWQMFPYVWHYLVAAMVGSVAWAALHNKINKQ